MNELWDKTETYAFNLAGHSQGTLWIPVTQCMIITQRDLAFALVRSQMFSCGFFLPKGRFSRCLVTIELRYRNQPHLSGSDMKEIQLVFSVKISGVMLGYKCKCKAYMCVNIFLLANAGTSIGYCPCIRGWVNSTYTKLS